MLRDWDKKYPGRVENIFSSLSTIVPSHLMDRSQFDFAELKITGTELPDGDIAFDEEPCESRDSTIQGHQTIHLHPQRNAHSAGELD